MSNDDPGDTLNSAMGSYLAAPMRKRQLAILDLVRTAARLGDSEAQARAAGLNELADSLEESVQLYTDAANILHALSVMTDVTAVAKVDTP